MADEADAPPQALHEVPPGTPAKPPPADDQVAEIARRAARSVRGAKRPPTSYAYVPGRYSIKIIRADLGLSGNGVPQVELLTQPLCRLVGESRDDVDGPPRYVYLRLTSGTLGTPDKPGWVWNLLQDLGFVGPSFADLEPIMGQVRDGEMRIETWRGTDNKPLTKEAWTLYAAPKPVIKPEAKEKLPELNAKFADLLKMAGGKGKDASDKVIPY